MSKAGDTPNRHESRTPRPGVVKNEGKPTRPPPSAQDPTEKQRQKSRDHRKGRDRRIIQEIITARIQDIRDKKLENRIMWVGQVSTEKYVV